MTAFLPSTRVTVARRTGATDVWGDDTGAASDVATGVPAALVEQTQRTYLGTEDRGGVVEQYTVRLRPGVDVREGDRLTTTEGLVLEVTGLSSPLSPAGLADVRVTARRTAARS